MYKSFSILFTLSLLFGQGEIIILHSGWEFRRAGTEIWYPAKVPGTTLPFGMVQLSQDTRDYGCRRVAAKYSTGHLVAVQFLGIPFGLGRKPWLELAGRVGAAKFRDHSCSSRLFAVLDFDCAECSGLCAGHLPDKTGKQGSPGGLLCDVPTDRILGACQESSG